MTRSRILPLIFVMGGVLLIIAAILLVIKPRQTAAPVAEATYPEIQRVTLADAKAAFDDNSALFVDVRDKESYNLSHIIDAVNFPLTDLANRLSDLPKDRWIITVCT